MSKWHDSTREKIEMMFTYLEKVSALLVLAKQVFDFIPK
jgi:hypothetical protein